MTRSTVPASKAAALAIVIAMVIAAACSGGGNESGVSVTPSAPPTDSGGTVPEPPLGDLDHLGIDVRTVDPFGTITVTGVTLTTTDDTGAPVLMVEPDLSGIELRMQVPDLDPIVLDLFLGDNGITAVVPVHPLTPFDGGDVELQFVGRNARSTAVTVAVAPLERAPGAWNETTDELRDLLAAHAAALDADVETLVAADPAGLTPDEVVLAVAAATVDDVTAAGLARVADSLGPDEAELLDALVARFDPLADAPAPSKPIDGLARPSGSRGPSGLVTPAGIAGLPRRGHPAQLQCTTFDLAIGDAATLAQMINIGRSSQIGWARQKLAADVAALTKTTGGLSDAATAVGSRAAPVAGAFSTAAEALNFLYTSLNVWSALDGGRYPTHLNSLSVEFSPTEFNEDFIEPGQIAEATVIASSTGFDASELAQITDSVLGFLGSMIPFDKVLGLDGDGLAGTLGGVVGNGTGKVAQTSAGGLLRKAADLGVDWCPQIWSVPIADPDYLELRSALGRLSVDPGSLGYEPTEVGDDFLTAAVRPEKFRGLTVHDQSAIGTRRLGVNASPTRIVTAPGETHTIHATAVNADTTTLYWNPGAGTWTDGIGDDTNDAMTRPIQMPTDPDAYPFGITIWSTSETGLRDVGWQTDPRTQTVQVELAGFVVQPDPGSVAVEQELAFVAVDHEGEPVAVEWSATGGSIDANGRYTAGDTPGTYTVTAVSTADPTQRVTVAVIVTDPQCLVGTWRITPENFIRLFPAEAGDLSPAGGEWTITVNDDLTFASVLNGFAFSMSGQGVSGRVVVDGLQEGRIEATDTHITSVETFSHTIAVTIETPAGSFNMDDVGGVDVDLANSAYSCEDGNLIIDRDGYSFLYEPVR